MLPLACLGALGTPTAPVMTEDGPLIGVATPLGASFRGVPFAKPPVGDLRWAAPQPPTKWTAPRRADAWGGACPQQCRLPPGGCPAPDTISEDCLYLNVYVPPATNASAKRPVLFFIPGGRFEQGSAGVELYDGVNLAAAGPAVVVTTNYRFGVLGFMATAGFRGNFGILDQQLALRWVRRNIGAFGGDPDAVTIFGQSAGGASVSTHLVSGGSAGLFHRAIAQSDPLSLPLLTMDEAKKHYDVFVKDAKCSHGKAADVVACLRGLAWPAVVAAQTSAQQKVFLSDPLTMFMPWAPVVDGAVLTGQPLELIQAGRHANVSLMSGTVGQEALMFVFDAFTKRISKVEAEALVRLIWKGDDVAKRIFAMYPWPTPKPDDYRNWFSTIGTDFVMVCPLRNASNVFAAAGLPTYRYLFNHSWSAPGAWGPNFAFCEGRACHGVELPYVFDSAALVVPPVHFNAAGLRLEQQTSHLWAAFGVSGAPAAAGTPAWPRGVPGRDVVYEIQSPAPAVLTGYRKAQCDLWDQLGYSF